MPQVFHGYATLRGADNRQVTLRYNMGEFTGADAGTEYEAAVAALGQITGALENVTDAVLVQSGVIQANAILGGNGAGDLFEKALVNVWAVNESDPLDVEARAQIYIPAPVIGLFQTAAGPGRNIVDVTDADLQQYVQQLAQHALISDGETIQTGSGTAGIDSGKRISKPFKV